MKLYSALLIPISLTCFINNSVAETGVFPQQVNTLQQQAKQGNADAMNDLGNMYSDGNGVPQDRTKSLVLLKKAYRLGNPEAAFNIAVIYYTGNDPYESISWFQKAAKQGNGEASNNLGIIYGYGQGVSQDTDKAMKYFKQACKHNSVKGCVNYEKIQ